MIHNKKELQFYIMADNMMNRGQFNPSLKQRLKNIIFPDCIMQYLESMRKVSYYSHIAKPLTIKTIWGGVLYVFNKMKFYRLGIKLGFSIGPDVFDYGLVIPHYGTIVVGPSNRIGKYAVLHTSICITDSHKIIGDGLYCSSGSKLVFNGTLGSNITIGANCVVTREVNLNNKLLVSTPAIIKSDHLSWYSYDSNYCKRVALVEQLRNTMNID